jgi:hypothetical protein
MAVPVLKHARLDALLRCLKPMKLTSIAATLALSQLAFGQKTELIGLLPTLRVKTVAADDFSSYAPGIGSLLGQPVGGFGFAGTWHSVGSMPPLVGNLDVFADGTVGSQSTTINSNAGNAVDFASPLGIFGGQLFIRYTYINMDTADANASSRLDLNYGNELAGNRVLLGTGLFDTFTLAVEDNLDKGTGAVVADSGIRSTTMNGRHVLVGLLDEKFSQIAIWVDPDSTDFYNGRNGASSADARKFWAVPIGGLTNFVSYSLIRNQDDDVKFDRVVFALAP